MSDSPSADYLDGLFDALTDPQAIAAARASSDDGLLAKNQVGDGEEGVAIAAWLGDLSLLKGVPFQYVVPNPRMLPPESLRFFFLDDNWILHLIDGACSIGRRGKVEAAHDTVYSDETLNDARLASRCRRDHALGLEVDADLAAAQPSQITGFVIRSSAVAEWPGLEFDAYGADDNTPLKLLRLERLATGVVIAFFAGDLRRLRIRKGGESLHFALSPEPGKYEKRLRALTGEMREDVVTVPFRNPKRVIKAKELADAMQAKLNADQFTSAEFALQMVEPVEQLSFVKHVE